MIEPIEPERRRRDRAASEAALVAAAQEEFSRHGFNGATTRAIASRAGCSEALIQNYFGSKEGLLFAVMRTETGGLANLLDPVFFGRPRPPTIEQEAEELLAFAVAAMRRLAPWLRILLDRVLLDPDFAARFAETTPRRQLVAAVVERIRREWPEVPDPDLAAEMAVSLGFEVGFVYPVLLGRSEEDAARYGPSCARMLAGLMRN